MLIQMLKPDFIHQDGRGCLTQLTHGNCNQVNVVISAKGTFRGGHYHKNNKESFFVIKGMFALEVSKGEAREEYMFRVNEMFAVPSFVKHSFRFMEDTVLVAIYDKGIESTDGTKDIFV
jgi:dTDP-4-dehydrorhamnose 3,5-epimerase-like enzyme